MASHVSGIAITIKAFLPTGKTLDKQFQALSLVKDAHASGDYSAVLKAAKIDEVKAEQKTRRIEEQQQATTETVATEDGDGDKETEGETAGDIDTPTGFGTAELPDEEIPTFLKRGKKSA